MTPPKQQKNIRCFQAFEDDFEVGSKDLHRFNCIFVDLSLMRLTNLQLVSYNLSHTGVAGSELDMAWESLWVAL